MTKASKAPPTEFDDMSTEQMAKDLEWLAKVQEEDLGWLLNSDHLRAIAARLREGVK